MVCLRIFGHTVKLVMIQFNLRVDSHVTLNFQMINVMPYHLELLQTILTNKYIFYEGRVRHLSILSTSYTR